VFIPWCDDDHGSAYSIRASRTFRSGYFTNNQDDEAIIRFGFTHRELGETKLITAAFIASASLAVTVSAQAMPIAPLGQPDVGAVIQVFGGCGWDGHQAIWRMPPALQLSAGLAHWPVGPSLHPGLSGGASPGLSGGASPGLPSRATPPAGLSRR
jgi:hypothetical protein